MAASSSIRLFDVEPDLIRFLSAEDRAEATNFSLATERVGRGAIALAELLSDANAFGAIVIDGVLLQSLQIGEQVGFRLIGPGDVIGLGGEPTSALRSGSATRTESPATLALMGNETLVAVHRWPRFLVGLLARVASLTERVADQLVICQLPRVEDRVQAIMWQLAETWGYVTTAGTVVPLTLTHEMLGGLIGARRSTVTLALGRLAEQGAVVRSGDEWLLLERPPRPAPLEGEFVTPTRVEQVAMSDDRMQRLRDEEERAVLRATVKRLHDEHQRARDEVRENLRQLGDSLVRSAALRDRVAADALSRRRAPSA